MAGGREDPCTQAFSSFLFHSPWAPRLQHSVIHIQAVPLHLQPPGNALTDTPRHFWNHSRLSHPQSTGSQPNSCTHPKTTSILVSKRILMKNAFSLPLSVSEPYQSRHCSSPKSTETQGKSLAVSPVTIKAHFTYSWHTVSINLPLQMERTGAIGKL